MAGARLRLVVPAPQNSWGRSRLTSWGPSRAGRTAPRSAPWVSWEACSGSGTRGETAVHPGEPGLVRLPAANVRAGDRRGAAGHGADRAGACQSQVLG